MKTILAAAFGLLLLSAPAKLFADNESDAHEHAGVDIGGEAAWFHNDRVIPNKWYGGVDLRFHFAPAIALEAATDWNRQGGTDYLPTRASLLIFLAPGSRLTPYILGGGTWYFNNGTAVSNSLFGPHVGAGLEFFLSKDWSVAGDWRYLWVENPNSGGGYFNHAYLTNSYMITAGLHYHF